MRPTLLATLVLDLYARITDQGELADHALHRTLRGHRELHSSERRIVSRAVYAMIRMRRRIDYLIDLGLVRAGLPGIEKVATVDAHRLRYAAALVLDLGESEASAIRMAGVPAVQAAGVSALNATNVKWPKDPVARLGIEESLPAWVADRFIEEYGDQAAALAHSLGTRAPLTLRANTLKATAAELQSALEKEGIESKLTSLSPIGVTLADHHNVLSTEAYKAGLFEIQDEGSQLIALATGAKAGDRVIDACAGGGGKTLALSAMMNNKSVVVACDVDSRRMKDIRPRAKLAGAFNIQPLVVPEGAEGDRVLKPWLNRADVVLVDAPCSGTGAWRRHPDARWRLAPTDVARFAETQARILRRFAACVKPGGLLVYATCSLFRAENDSVADAFAQEQTAFVPEPLAVPETARDPSGRLRLTPHRHGTDGFFAAGFRRADK